MTDLPEDEDSREIPIPERTERLAVTVGHVWREARVSCPHLDLLRAYREGGLLEEQQDYLRFHVETAECPYCQAKIEAMAQEEADMASRCRLEGVRERLLSSTLTFLKRRKTGKD